VLSPSWEAANCAAIQEIPNNCKEPEGSSPCSQQPSTGSYPEPVRSIHTIPSYLSKIDFNIVHPPTSWSSKWSLSFWLSHQRLDPLSNESVHIRGFLWIFVTITVRSCSPTPNPQAGGPPLVGCPRLLIQYIRSYPLNLEADSSIRNLRTRHTVVTRDPPNMAYEKYTPRCQWCITQSYLIFFSQKLGCEFKIRWPTSGCTTNSRKCPPAFECRLQLPYSAVADVASCSRTRFTSKALGDSMKIIKFE
jgi:hypothetical protein